MVRLPRVETLLGASLDDVDEAALQRLIGGGVREDVDLEFKRDLYGGSDLDKRELAKDIAGMANHRGGLLVIGIDDTDGAATALTPVELSEDAELRMRQVIASLIAPAPLLELRPLPSGSGQGRGYYLIAVPRSPLAPHAVRFNDALRYHRRDGTRTRPLHESEVADAYRSRFAGALTRRRRLEDALAECAQAPTPQEEHWLLLGVSPQVPGDTEWGAAALRRVRDWTHDHLDALPHGLALYGSQAHHIQPGYRRFVHSDRFASGQTVSQYHHIELHRDGTAVATVNVHLEVQKGTAGYMAGISDQWLTVEIIALLRLLSSAAVELAGCWGDAAVHASLRPAQGRTLQILHKYGLGGAYRPHPMTSPVAPTSLRSLSVEEVAHADGTLMPAKGIVEDLLSAFGFAQCDYIDDDDGALVPGKFNRGWQEALAAWAGPTTPPE